MAAIMPTGKGLVSGKAMTTGSGLFLLYNYDSNGDTPKIEHLTTLCEFLGFTHISGKTRRGDFTIHRRTSWKKFQAKLAELKEKLSRNRHADLATVGQWLQSVYRGRCQYYAVPGNYARLQQFRDAIQVMRLRALRRRSQRGRRLTWSKFSKLSKRWLPTPTILHPYPNVRFACQHPRQEPYAVVLHVRICAGGGQ